MAGLGWTEILIILAVVMLLFGSAKLPQLARSLGRSARILKAETKGLREDDETPQPAQPQAQQPPVQQPPAQPYAPPQGQLPPGQPIQGVPVDPNQARKH
ncbi:Sec-independent protein translocase subunit TatA [Thermomonospora cellulosilytica]|uniref:Sec-independent protein translocase protein TatA n=1 Tax=Thermomonospora cellulosilytica TaxID=1411118 RepID=A0A7W3RAT2_9ACTN|nr:Sec-independent protein translocase subunit TatA [Thermomonospora cellulosilytica]MBA9006029.1 sec-independent protein translocase protein TatA [Thermomonospora cellulosilytica]